MAEITRTLCQWQVTAYRLDRGDHHDLDTVGRIREEALADVQTPLDHRITFSCTAEEAAMVLAQAPLSAWRMPMSAIWLVASVEGALAEAEAIIQAVILRYRQGLPPGPEGAEF